MEEVTGKRTGGEQGKWVMPQGEGVALACSSVWYGIQGKHVYFPGP